MELLNGMIRGLTSLKEGQQIHLSEDCDVFSIVQFSSSVKVESGLKLKVSVQSLGSDFVVNFESIELTVKAPCTTCGHRLERQINCEGEYLAIAYSEVPSGNLDLRDYLKDIILTAVGESLPCLDDPCEWREDVDLYLGRTLKQKEVSAFHPFQELLSEKKLKKSHQES